MNKYLDFITALNFNYFAFLMWKLKNIFAATSGDFYFGISALILFNLGLWSYTYCIYLKKTNYILVNLILVFLLLYRWFSSAETSFTYHYNMVDTVITFLCFIMMLIKFVCIIINGINKYKNKKEVPYKL